MRAIYLFFFICANQLHISFNFKLFCFFLLSKSLKEVEFESSDSHDGKRGRYKILLKGLYSFSQRLWVDMMGTTRACEQPNRKQVFNDFRASLISLFQTSSLATFKPLRSKSINRSLIVSADS